MCNRLRRQRGTLNPCDQYLVLVLLRTARESPILTNMGAYKSAPWRPKENDTRREVLPNHPQLSDGRARTSLLTYSPASPQSVCLRCKNKNILSIWKVYCVDNYAAYQHLWGGGVEMQKMKKKRWHVILHCPKYKSVTLAKKLTKRYKDEICSSPLQTGWWNCSSRSVSRARTNTCKTYNSLQGQWRTFPMLANVFIR